MNRRRGIESKREPSHPGAVLEAALEHAGVSISAAARALGVSRQRIYDVRAGRARVSPEIAIKLGAFFGNGAGFWIRMQAAWDVWHAERARRPRVVPLDQLLSGSRKARR